jgi:hypothetical protein
MFVQFEYLPPTARIWIYQANRPLTPAEEAAVQPLLRHFATDLTSHGRALQASAAFLYHQFLVVGLDENVADASGCSIDASVRFVHELEARLGITLLEKSNLAFLLGGQVCQLDRRELRAAVADGRLQPDTPYFDATITTHAELQHRWPAPATATWLKRYFPAPATNGVPEGYNAA